MAMIIKIYIKYGGMLNDDDRQLSTPNYNNINSFFYSSTKYHRTYNKKTCRGGCGNMCHGLWMAQITICKDKSVNGIIDD